MRNNCFPVFDMNFITCLFFWFIIYLSQNLALLLFLGSVCDYYEFILRYNVFGIGHLFNEIFVNNKKNHVQKDK